MPPSSFRAFSAPCAQFISALWETSREGCGTLRSTGFSGRVSMISASVRVRVCARVRFVFLRAWMGLYVPVCLCHRDEIETVPGARCLVYTRLSSPPLYSSSSPPASSFSSPFFQARPVLETHLCIVSPISGRSSQLTIHPLRLTLVFSMYVFAFIFISLRPYTLPPRPSCSGLPRRSLFAPDNVETWCADGVSAPDAPQHRLRAPRH